MKEIRMEIDSYCRFDWAVLRITTYVKNVHFKLWLLGKTIATWGEIGAKFHYAVERYDTPAGVRVEIELGFVGLHFAVAYRRNWSEFNGEELEA